MKPALMVEDLPVLPLDNFGNWAYAFCVVTFDLELGQALELVYPPHKKFTEREKNNICYLAFPDSNSGLMGNVQYHFRTKCCPSSCRQKLSIQLINYNQNCPPALQIDNNYLFGYVYFRQVKDKSFRRGYLQKSLVLLSKLPLVPFFNSVMEFIAPEYFENGEASLEAVCFHMDEWPPPCPGESLTLPLLGCLFQVRIPSKFDKAPQNADEKSSPLNSHLFKQSSHIIHSPYELELIITAEPLVVMSSSPTVAACTVQTLVSLIYPLKYSADFRPFFTIHDSEFKEYTTRTIAPPDVILGVTNPFFSKTLQHWPNVIKVPGNEESLPHMKNRSKKFNLLKVDQKAGVFTKSKAFLSSDKAFIKRLLKGVQSGRPVQVQSALLRRHMLELTQSFIIPLERYITSLMPLKKDVVALKAPPKLKPFNPEEFLSTLEISGPHLTTGIKGDWEGLYRRFFHSVNFFTWFNSRYHEASKKITVLHIQILSETDMTDWIKDKAEVEIVDMVLRLQSKINVGMSASVLETVIEKLKSQIGYLISSLPEDLQSAFNRS